jgi:O-antigen/teichoic acid export membrane protein
MLVVSFMQSVLDFGATTALLRKDVVTEAEVNSAWTLRMLEGFGIALLLLALAPLAAWYFKEPRVEAVMWVLAACLAISGAANIGFTLAQKEFNFSLEFRHHFICKTLGVLATITAAYYLRDYRALVIGIATGYTSESAMSYVMHRYRPRWNTSKIPYIWSITKWLMLASLGGFFLRKGDELIAARIGSTTEYGLYNVGADLGQLPTGELGPAMLRAFLPVLSSIQDDLVRTNQAVLKTLAAVNTITMPVGLGFAAVALPATELMLGSKWTEVVPLVTLFAVAGVVQFMMSPLSTLLVLRGHTRLQNRIVWFEFTLFVLACIVFIPGLHLLGLVFARITASGATALITAAYTKSYCNLSLVAVAKALMRPLAGALCMVVVVHMFLGQWTGSAWALPLAIAVGVLVYSGWSLITWLLMGRPEGLESTAVDFFNKG